MSAWPQAGPSLPRRQLEGRSQYEEKQKDGMNNNNNNTFTWSCPSGVFGFIGQRPVGPLVTGGASQTPKEVTVVTLCH
jgi:hypothetical protein